MDPFRHLTVEEALRPEAANAILEWLESTDQFETRHDSANRPYYQFNITRGKAAAAPPIAREVFDLAYIDELRRPLEELFQTRLRARCSFIATRYLPGCLAVAHRDYLPRSPERDGPTHFFIIYINAGWCPKYGGELTLQRSSKPEDVVKKIAPLHNAGLGMALGRRSYHAVNKVEDGTRYGIQFGFVAESGWYQDG
ncbi:2OG-Fe(II) oxygenase [Pendulispora rubella]|uniref:2OG-Fe(II) oxygenase n=1 Tax=Pendulispora rubella TaxID=2741070 RepID=A0ABZ2KPH2_9BACT